MRKNFLGVFTLLVGSCASIFAQQNLSGTVQDSSGSPLIGATVIEAGTGNGAVTDVNGKFILTVDDVPALLQASYVGYSTAQQTATDATSPINFVLNEDTSQLQEVIVTGFASSVKRENAANAVSVVKAEELTGTTTQTTMDGALYGKFAGAELRSNSGAPGGGMSVRLRGVSSIFGNQQPLYIIDGVFIDNKTISLGTNVASAAAGGGNSATNQDDASNRIADIDPDDIESLEVLKGASAAAIYGSKAAGGVIIITTKKGQAGATKVSFAQESGISRPIRLLGLRSFDDQKILDTFGQSALDAKNQNGLTDYEAELFDRSPYQGSTRLEFSGGSENTQYFVGGSLINQNGLVENTGYDKKSVRVNVNTKVGERIKLDFATNYVNSESDRGYFNNSNNNSTIGYGRAFTEPWENLFPNEAGVYPSGSSGSNVLETVALITNKELNNRFIGGATANIDLIKKDNTTLTAQLRGGVDQYNLQTKAIFPRQLSYFRDGSNPLLGVSVAGNAQNKNSNQSAFLVFSSSPSDALSLTSQAGVTRETSNLEIVRGIGTNLNGSQTNIDQAANNQVDQTIQPREDKGFFVQQEANFGDKVILTAGLRGDKSTNNGDANKLYYYPKANAAFRFDEFDFWNSEAIDQFKVRVAYGESGRPTDDFSARSNLFGATAINGSSGFISSNVKGNNKIEPERQTELEFGTDISVLDSKYNLTATYYIKTIDDLLLRASVPSSSGYSIENVNAGKLRNNGIELELNAYPLEATDSAIEWESNLRWWKNNSKVVKLDVPDFTTGGFAASLGTYMIKEGYSPTSLVGTYVDGDCSDCETVDVNGTQLRIFGNAEPDFNMSWGNTLNYNNFGLSFLWHWKNGGDGINLSTLLYDLNNTTWDFDDTSLDPSGELSNGAYRKSLAFRSASPWIEDTGYLRLREVGLSYNVPEDVFNDFAKLKLGISGKNLINVFNYNSYDPEVSNFGNNVLANSVEVTPYPSSKSLTFSVKATF